MAENQHQVIWTLSAQKQMKHLYEYISKDSIRNANKVIEDIAIAVDNATRNPEIYSPDKYKINNDGSYRAFEKHRYRISYRFTKNIIRVLRICHTSMKPKPY